MDRRRSETPRGHWHSCVASPFHRKLDVKYGALFECGLGPQLAAVCRDDAPADRQPETEPQGLRAVERLEQLFHPVGRYAVTGIGDRYADMAVAIPGRSDEEQAVAIRP